MAIGYFLGIGGMAIEPTGTEFYERYEVMRNWCEQVHSWTGCEMPSLFTDDHRMSLTSGSFDAQHEPADLSVRPEFLYRGQVRQVAHAIGISDVLAEQGIYPDLIAGTSLGGIIAACLAGSIEREDVFWLLDRVAELPLAPAGEPARGIGFAVLPPDADIDWYCGESRANVYVAGDYELSGENTMLLLSGYLRDLEKLAAEAPPGHVPVVTSAVGGMHSPLQQFMADLIEPSLHEIRFRDPEIPLLSGIGGAASRAGVQLKTGDEVRQGILDNYVEPVGSVKQMIAAFGEHDTQLGLALGAALPAGVPPGSFPVLQAYTPDDIGQVVTMIYDLGIDVGR